MNLYGIENRNTISKAIKVADRKTTLNEVHSLNLKYVTSAVVIGYMNVNLSTIHAYNGRYGKGYVRTTSKYYNGKISSNYMVIEYWVEK